MVGLATAYHAYEIFEQGHAAVHTPHAVREFAAAPSFTSAFNVGGKVVGVIGADRVVGSLVKFGVKLALKSRKSDEDAAQEMVDLMKSRVPQDTGKLLNGISFEFEDNTAVVTASAINPKSRPEIADYARFVEHGTEHMAARPYFYNSAEEVLAKRGQTLDDAIGQAASEEGLT
jgi:HK97 gp10 family phage protein